MKIRPVLWIITLAILGSAHSQERPTDRFYVRTAGFLDLGVIPWTKSPSYRPEHGAGLTLIRQGKYDEAAQAFYASTRKHPENLISHLGYVTANVARGTEAVAAMVDAYAVRIRLENSPSSEWTLAQNLALLAGLVELTRLHPVVGGQRPTREIANPYVLEIEATLSMIGRHPARSRDEALWRSNIHNRMGRLDLRRAVLVEYLSSQPRDYLVRHQLAKTYQGGATLPAFPPNFDPVLRAQVEKEARDSQLRMDLSLVESERIIREHPEFGPAYFLAGSSSYFLKQLTKAKQYLTTYLKLEPNGIRADEAKQYLAKM